MVADDLDASLGDRGRREVPEYNATLPAQDPLGGGPTGEGVPEGSCEERNKFLLCDFTIFCMK